MNINSTIRILLGAINFVALIAATFLFYTILVKVIKYDAEIIGLSFPFYLMVLFSSNLFSLWRYPGTLASILLIIGNLIIIPVIQIIIAFALPVTLAIVKQLSPESESEILMKVTYSNYLFLFMSISTSLLLLYRIFENRKSKRLLEQENEETNLNS